MLTHDLPGFANHKQCAVVTIKNIWFCRLHLHNLIGTVLWHDMMTSLNGNIYREFPSQKPLVFSLICALTSDWVNNRDAGDLRRNRAYYNVTVMRIDYSTISSVWGIILHMMWLQYGCQSVLNLVCIRVNVLYSKISQCRCGEVLCQIMPHRIQIVLKLQQSAAKCQCGLSIYLQVTVFIVWHFHPCWIPYL